MVGRYVLDASGLGFVVPFDKKILIDIQVQPTETKGAQPGEMVTVEITRWPTATRNPAGRIVEVLGDIDAPGVDLQVIIRKYGIPDAHGDEAVTEATRLGSVVEPKDIEGRTDFRAVPTVTIDGEHARDFDDAITIERLPNGHYWLGVHIADVVALRAGGERARRRGLRARHLGLLPRARRAHVPARAVDRALLARTRRSIASCSRA